MPFTMLYGQNIHANYLYSRRVGSIYKQWYTKQVPWQSSFTMASQKYSINCVGFSIQVVNQIISDILPYWYMPGLEVDIRVQPCCTHCDPLPYQSTRLVAQGSKVAGSFHCAPLMVAIVFS